MAGEIMNFVQTLGHVEIGLYGGNEPTIRSLLRILLNCRQAMGLRGPIQYQGEGLSRKLAG